MTRRANGEGSVRQRANGASEARLSFTDTETGRVERVSLYGPTAKAVPVNWPWFRMKVSPPRTSPWRRR